MVDLGKVGSKEVRKRFKTLTDARSCADDRRMELDALGQGAKLLPQSERVDATAALEVLKEFDTNLLVAAEFYAKHHRKVDRRNGTGHLIDAYLEFQAQRVEDGMLRPRSHEDMGRRLRPLKDDLGHVAIDVVSGDDLKKILSKHKPQNRANYQRYFSMFFRWCVKNGSRDSNPIDRMEAVKLDDHAPEVYTPNQVAAIFKSTTTEMTPYLALAFFGGVRPDEIRRLDWSDIELTDGVIHIRASVSKTKRARFVEMPKNLREWLATCPNREGLVFPHSTSSLHRWRTKVYRDAGAPSIQDGARHSAATYFLALHTIEETTEMLGHSDKVLFRHYRGLMKGKKTKAKKYFDIRPGQKSGVAKFPIKEKVA